MSYADVVINKMNFDDDRDYIWTLLMYLKLK